MSAAGTAADGVVSNSTGTAKTDSDGDGQAEIDGRVRRAVRPTLVALSYLLLACLVYWPVSPLASHRVMDCACSDPVQEYWFLHWTAWAVSHGHNPFYTYYLHAPAGANLAVNTSFPLLGVLAMPVTLTLGPIAAYNLLLRVALALSAIAMYAVLRRYTAWWPAAYAGGLLFGFSPYMIGHAHRHLFLTFLPLLPLFVPAVDEWLVRARRNPYLWGGVVGLLTAGEFLISPEIAVLIVIAVVLGLLALAVGHRDAVRSRLAPLGKGLLAAGGVLVVVAGLPAYLFLRGKQRPVGPLHPLADLYRYYGDLVAPVVPTKGEFFAPSGSGSGLVAHSVVENGFYLGIPLVALLLFLLVRYRREPLILAASAVGAIAFVFGLGPALVVDGHRVVPVMPFRALEHLPLLQNIEPARLSLFVQMAAAVVLAVGLDRLRADRWPRPGLAGVRGARVHSATVAAVGVLALLPLLPRIPLPSARVHAPRFFTTSAVRLIPQGALVLTYPYSRTPANVPMIWQSASGMRFRIFGGDVFVPERDGSSTWHARPPSPPNIDALLLPQPGHAEAALADPELPARVRQFLRRYKVHDILVDPHARYARAVTSVIVRAVGSEPRLVRGMEVWLRVPSLLSPKP